MKTRTAYRVLGCLIFSIGFLHQKATATKELLPDTFHVVAHRGASGLLPEHTIQAYELAIAQVCCSSAIVHAAPAGCCIAGTLSTRRHWRCCFMHKHLCACEPSPEFCCCSQGAHFIECDVVLTRDCQPICRHEPDISQTTDALKKFPDRQRNVTIDGINHQVCHTKLR